MKKILTIIIICSLGFYKSYAQTIQASIGVGSQPNRVKIYLKADVTQSPSSISTLQFNIGVVSAGIPAAPTLTVLSSAFPSVVWQQYPAYIEGGFWNFNIFTSTSPLTPSFTANTEFEAMEIEFNNGNSLADVALVTLPDGGTSGSFNALFLATGTVSSNGMSNLYYARTGVTVNNQNSYDPVNNTPQIGISSALITSVSLPVKFLGFNVSKKNNDAVLTWQIENETSETDHYEVERSVNGVDFVKMASITPKNNGNSSNAYSFTDGNLFSTRSGGVIYYRIKQIDKDGKFIITPIRNLRLDSKAMAVSVYPNPIQDNAIISLDLVKDEKVVFTINDAAGKQIRNISYTLFKGLNVKKIDMSGVASGNYMLKVTAGSELKTIPLVKAK